MEYRTIQLFVTVIFHCLKIIHLFPCLIYSCIDLDPNQNNFIVDDILYNIIDLKDNDDSLTVEE
jgi:hypothetical protein